MRRPLRYLTVALILGLLLILTIPIPTMAASAGNPSPSSGVVGTNITISGTADLTTDNILIRFGSNDVDSPSVDTSLSWTSSFIVPEAPAGNQTITIYINGTPTFTKTFRIIPSITLSKSSASAGSSISVSGRGFQASDGNISIMFGDTNVLTVTSNANGSFPSTSFTIPAVASGVHTITATDTASTPNTATANLTTISNASITLNKTSGTGGSSVIVSGTGFVGSESNIVVTYDGNPIGSPTTASLSGTWSISINIPASYGGTHYIGASGALTKASEVTAKTFTVISGLTISKNSGPPGTQITVTGSGFTDGEQGITVTWDGSPIGNQVNAGRTGAWTSTITIPQSSAGPHIIDAYGPTTSSVTANLIFTVGAGISLNESSGTVGTSINISGAGFGVNDKNISITFEGIPNPIATISKTTEGAWTANFIVPPSAGGDHTITAVTGSTRVTTVFTTLPSINIDAANGTAGSIITASGLGFSANQKDISIKFDDNVVMGNITASSTGSWTTSFPVPNAASGSHTISIAGAEGANLNVNSITFMIKPAVSLSPENGSVGTSVVVKGSGFIAGSSINITFDDNNLAKTTALSDGSFSKSVEIPVAKAGDHEIKANDSANSAVANFSIDSTPPPIPTPISPKDGSTVGFMGNITPSFSWARVTSGSSITYTFQLDSDPDFPNPLEKSGLTATKYTLSKGEALPRGNYYWRVRAVDAAGNESAWSQTQYLKSGLISPGLFAFLLILVIAAIAVGYYFLRTKILPKRRAIGTAGPEIVIPEIVNAEFKQIESGKSALPWRLALPQAPQQPKGSKTLSSEDQARLKVIIDFAKSLPLPQPGSNTDWLVELAENITGNSASPALYAQILKGEIQVRYEPAWMRHPTFLDLQALLEGQPIMQDLTTFVDTTNTLVSSASQVLQDIYQDTAEEITWDIIANKGWGFISGIYTDGIGWFQGKNLKEPSDRDYMIKTEPAGNEHTEIGLYGEPNTAFSGLLVKASDEAEAQQLRSLHLKLRRTYRSSDKLKDLVSLIAQLEVQRNRLLSALSQFSRLTT